MTSASGFGLAPQSTGYKQLSEKIPSGYRKGRLQQYTPEQMQLFQSLFSNVTPDSYLARLSSGEPSSFSEMEAPAWQQFGEALGQLGSRFSGMGMGAQKGSGFNIAGSRAAQEFAESLAARRSEMQRQALADLMGYSNALLGQRPYEQFLMKKPSILNQLLGGGLGLAGAGLGAYFGGPAGAGIGGQIGSSFGQGLMGGY